MHPKGVSRLLHATRLFTNSCFLRRTSISLINSVSQKCRDTPIMSLEARGHRVPSFFFMLGHPSPRPPGLLFFLTLSRPAHSTSKPPKAAEAAKSLHLAMVVAAAMEPHSTTGLKNHYWVLRHGRSIPNEAGLIVSYMSNGVLPNYGLAPAGFVQAKGAGALFLKELEVAGIPLDHVRIFASPFRRTLETAETVVNSLGAVASAKPSIKSLDGIRERYFGAPLEFKSHDHYPEIWAIDAIDPMVGPEGGESVADVAIRVSEALVQMEADVQGCGVLVVSHGDTLQILQAVVHSALSQISSAGDATLASLLADAITRPVLSRHHAYALLTGELRRLA